MVGVGAAEGLEEDDDIGEEAAVWAVIVRELDVMELLVAEA